MSTGGILFIGSKDLGVEALRFLIETENTRPTTIVTCDDKDDARSRLDEFRMLSGGSGIELTVLKKAGDLSAIVMNCKPNVCIVVGWYWLIKPEVLKIPPLGFVGFHASLLPAYRGAAPLVWPIINGDEFSGISMFVFDDGIDTGDLLFQERFAIGKRDTIADALAKADVLMKKGIREVLPAYLAGTIHPWKQSDKGISYASPRLPSDGQVNWRGSNERVHDFIRAQTRPYPGAFSFLPDGRKLVIWACEPFPHPYSGIPGQVVQLLSDGAVVVCCGSGAVVVREVGVDGVAVIPSSVMRYNVRLP